MNSTIIILIIMLMIGCLVVALQIFLSKKENKWLGLILPIICLVFSIMAVMGMLNFNTHTRISTIVTENGQTVKKEIINIDKKGPFMGASEMGLSIGMIFVVTNIPTVILIGIYRGCRRKRKNLELEKMNIQDLE